MSVETIHLATVAKELMVQINKEFLGFFSLKLDKDEMRLAFDEKHQDYLTADELLEKYFKDDEPRVFVFNWIGKTKNLHVGWMVFWIPEGLSEEDQKLWKEVIKQDELHNFVDDDHRSIHNTRQSIEELLKSK